MNRNNEVSNHSEVIVDKINSMNKICKTHISDLIL